MQGDDQAASAGPGGYPPGWDWDEEFVCQTDEEYALSLEASYLTEANAGEKIALDEKRLEGLLEYLGAKPWSRCPELVRMRAGNLLEHSLLRWGIQHPSKAERFALEAMEGLGSRASHEYAGLHGMAALGARIGRSGPLGWGVHVDWHESSDGDGMWSKHLQALVLGSSPEDWQDNLAGAARASLQSLAQKMEWTSPGAIGALEFATGCMGKAPEMPQYALAGIDWRRLYSAWSAAQCSSELETAAGPGVAAPRRATL